MLPSSEMRKPITEASDVDPITSLGMASHLVVALVSLEVLGFICLALCMDLPNQTRVTLQRHIFISHPPEVYACGELVKYFYQDLQTRLPPPSPPLHHAQPHGRQRTDKALLTELRPLGVVHL